MSSKKKIYYGWYIVVCGFLAMALVYASVVSCQGVFLKPVTEDLGISRTDFSAVMTFSAIGLILGSLFMGKLFKKYSLKKIMTICSLIVLVCFVGYGIASKIWQFYVIAPIMGIAFAGVTNIPVSILINNWFGQGKKGLAMSIALAGSGVGGMVLTVILNAVVQTFSWRIAYFTIAAMILIIILPLILFVIVATPAEKGLVRIGEDMDVSVGSGLSSAEAKKTFAFWLIFFAFLVVAMLNSGVLNHQIPYLSDIGFSAGFASTIAALAIGSVGIGKIILGMLCDKLGLKKGSFIGNFMFFLAMASLLMTANIHTLSYIYIVMFSIGSAAATVCPPLYVSELFGEKDFGSLVGFLNVANGLGGAFGSLLCGKLFDIAGNYTLCWTIFSILAALVVIMLWISLCKKPSFKK